MVNLLMNLNRKIFELQLLSLPYYESNYVLTLCTHYVQWIVCINSDMLVRFRLDCHHKLVSRFIRRFLLIIMCSKLAHIYKMLIAHQVSKIKVEAHKKELFVMLPIQIMSSIQILTFRVVLLYPKRTKYRLVVPLLVMVSVYLISL